MAVTVAARLLALLQREQVCLKSSFVLKSLSVLLRRAQLQPLVAHHISVAPVTPVSPFCSYGRACL